MIRSRLNDAVGVASAVCQITKRVILTNPSTTNVSHRPWPKQLNQEQQQQQVGGADHLDPDTDKTTIVDIVDAKVTAEKDANHQTLSKKQTTRPWSTHLRHTQLNPSSSSHSSNSSQVYDRQPSNQLQTNANVENISPSWENVASTTDLNLSWDTVQSTSVPTLESSSTRHRDQGTSKTDENEFHIPISTVKHKSLVADIESDTVSENPLETSANVISITSAQPFEQNSQHFPSVSKGESETISDSSAGSLPQQQEEYDAAREVRDTPLRAAKVPSTRFGRLLHYGGLGVGLAWGTAGQVLRSSVSRPNDESSSSIFMSEQNVSRLVDKLSTMRGAALKLGQFLSIQETKVLPPQIEKVLLRVQNSANYMPVWQMERVMSQELGTTEWRERFFKTFDQVPFASASIGQVHSATLRDDFVDPEMAGKRVAVKVQFPGVLESIDSDLSYLRWLVSASALMPKGLFLDNTLRVMSRELRDECDYKREAEMGKRFRQLLQHSDEFEVPKVVDQLSTGRVLVTEMMRGRPLTMASSYSQQKRDQLASSILKLSLSELFCFRLMQTDPNWSNFLYNERTGKIQLIDFGATREYSKPFMDNWLRMLQAAIRGDHSECLEWSRKVGYLTGQESEAMEKAHVDSMIALGEPFREDAPNPYPFESQTITDRVKAQIPVMLRERLTPPPQETYSLNRKLSGAFLLCARLKAHVSCHQLFRHIESEYRFDTEMAEGKEEEIETPPASVSITSSGGGDGGSHTSSNPTHIASQRRSYHTSTIARKAQSVLDEKATTWQSPIRPKRHGINLADRFPRSKIIVPSPPTAKSASLASPTPDTPPPSPSPVPQPSSSTTICGISIPLKPPPPGPDECCMSGCAHCTYDIYAEDLTEYHSQISQIRKKLFSSCDPSEWRSDLLGPYPSSNQEGNEKVHDKAESEINAIIQDLDPSMKAFLEMERKIKKKKKIA